MKNLYLRTSVALACAFGLVACGGGSNNLQLGFAITGLTKDMTISNNGGTPITIPAGSSSYIFPDLIGSDSNFDIKVVTQPPNATCTIYYGTGKTGAYSPTGIVMQCIATPHNVTAAISGLTTSGLVVVNGSMRYTIPANPVNNQFSFTLVAADGTKTGQVGDGNAYGFAILTQPTGQTCTIPNGGGIMANQDVVININCV